MSRPGALRGADTVLQRVLSGMQDQFYVLDGAWRYVFVNERVLECVGRGADALLGHCIWDLFPDLVGTDFQRQLAEAVSDGQPRRFEFHHAKRERWFENAVHPTPDGLVVQVSDVTDLERYCSFGTDAVPGEQRFARFMQHLPGLAWIKDLAGRYVFANDAAVRAFGVSRSNLLGRTDEQIFPGATARLFRDNDALALQRDGMQAYEELEVEDGSKRTSLVSKFPMPGPDGRAALIGGIAIDVTERRQAEEALRESELKFRALARAAPAIVWTAGPDGTITYANERWFAYVGSTSEQGLRDWPEALHPDDRERCVTEWSAAVQSGKDVEFELRIRRYDGAYRWFIVRAAAARDHDGRNIGWFGSSTDIHDLKSAEDELREAHLRKDEFLVTLAHELRNPLAPLRNGLEIMRLAKDSPQSLEQARSMMERQLRQLVGLVDDLLDLGRISRGKIELRKEPVSLAAAVQNALEESLPLINEHGHELSVEVCDDPLLVEGDLTRLAQVVANLLNNAAIYTDDRGHIRLTVERRGREAVVSVRDDGIGIPAHMLTQVFQIFAQARQPEQRGTGLGIGLSIVEQLVRMHGGRVEARSEGRGMGSEFIVRLPLAGTPAPLLHEPGDEAAPAGARHRVLIADDNADTASSLAIMLKLLGDDVRIARDGVEALEVADVFHPEVIVLDIGMPRMNGYEACRRLRATSWAGGSLIVAITGWGQREDVRRAQEAGFDGHLVKPVEPDAILTLINGYDRNDPAQRFDPSGTG